MAAPMRSEKQLVIICHDESSFNANEDQNLVWAEDGTQILKPKERGSGLMISDYIDEYNGYLKLDNDTFEEYVKQNPDLKRKPRAKIE